MEEASTTSVFESQQSYLLALAYRLLGSRADAEDAVQDTFLKWRMADHSAISNPAAWLTTACTRRCLDMLKAAQRTRVDYVGAWLPEPFHTPADDTPEATLELSSSLSTAFLLLLERLTPKERAAYLLHEVFDLDYSDVAAATGMQEAACRKLVSRARANIGKTNARHVAPRERQQELLSEFQRAIATGRTDDLAALLSNDIVLTADGGGKVPALLHPVQGKEHVLGTIAASLSKWWSPYDWKPVSLNGACGVVLLDGNRIVAAVSFAFDEEDSAAGIYVVRNPDKLALIAHLGAGN